MSEGQGQTGRSGTSAGSETLLSDGEFGRVVVKAAANGTDLEELTRPLLEALAKLAGIESTYLMVFDWASHEQEVRFVHSTGSVEVAEGDVIALPEGLTREALPGVTRSPAELASASPDSMIARRLGLKAYVSVPVVVAKHQLFGMLCGASRASLPISESTISVMEFFAQIIADHVTRARTAATEERARAAEEHLHTRALFLAQAEHQLKTPLVVIAGAAVRLRDQWFDVPDSERTELLAMLVRNAQELTVGVEQLLLEARADVQARDLRPALLELEPLLHTITAAFDSVSGSHHVTAEVAGGAVAWADPIPLHQVIGHLLDNAIKYSPSGGNITVRAAPTNEDVQIDVIDEGMGLPDPEAIDVFEPFQRGPLNEVGATPGVGLGLHIVRTLVSSMGGSIAGRPNTDRGSTITIHLPASR